MKRSQLPVLGAKTSTWQTGAKFFQDKAGDSYTNGVFQPGVPTDAQNGAAAINSIVLGERTRKAIPGYRRGASWIYNSSCARDVMDNHPLDWSAPVVTPSQCTNSEVDQKKQTVTRVDYTNTLHCLATVSVAVTLLQVTSREDAKEAKVPLDSTRASLFKSKQWIGATGVQQTTTCDDRNADAKITAWTHDRNVSCQTYDVGIGRGSSAASHDDSVEFHRCKLPKSVQRVSAASSSATPCNQCSTVLGECNCRYCSQMDGIGLGCALRTSTQYQCVSQTADPAQNTQGVVLRVDDTYFTVPVAKFGKSICEWDEGMQNCPFFNGTIRSLADQQKHNAAPLFVAEPNPFVPSGTPNTRDTFVVPVTLSLMAPVVPASNRADPDAGKSFLQRLWECGCASETTDACCTVYTRRTGWQFLTGFYDRLVAPLSRNVASEPAYGKFAAFYFGYAATQVFFGGQYQFTGLVSQNYPGKYNFFLSESQWIESVCRPYFKLQFAGTGVSAGLTRMFIGTEGTHLFTDSLPYVGPLDEKTGTVPVRLTVPAVLFDLVLDGQGNASTAVLETLLLRLFPTTVASADGHGFQPASYFRSTEDSVRQLQAGIAEPVASPFQVMGIAAPDFYKLGLSEDGVLSATPGAARHDPDSMVVAATLTFVVQLQFPDSAGVVVRPSMTVLFYLYYLLRNAQLAMKDLDQNMFADTEVQEKFEPAPVSVKWPQACAIETRQMCSTNGRDGTEAHPLLYVGTGAYLLNRLFMTPESATCACLNGSNLPLHFPTRSLQPFAMCFNSRCNGAPVCLSNILNNLGNRDTCEETVPADVPYDCTQHCDEYVEVLRNNRTGIDLAAVDFGALERKCGFKALDLAQALDIRPYYLTGCVLGALGVPLLYAVVAGICAAQARTSGSSGFVDSLAANPAFYGTCIALTVLMAVVVGVVATQFRGEQVCRSTRRTADGFTVPSSECRVSGGMWDVFLGEGKSLKVPQDFCGDPQSYCQWWLRSGSSQSCRQGSKTAGCQEQAANGLCARSKEDPLSNRPIRAAKAPPIRWTGTGIVFSLGLGVFVTPVVIAAFLLLAPEFPGKVGVAVVLALVVLAACFALMYVQGATSGVDGGGAWQFYVGPCDALTEYPTRLVSTQQPEGVAQVTYELNGVLYNSAPVYELKTDDGVRRPVFGAASSAPRYLFVGGIEDTYVMGQELPNPTDEAGDAKVMYNSDTDSPVLYAPLNEETEEVPIFSTFVAYSYDATGQYVFCGQLGSQSTCGSGPGCPCASQNASSVAPNEPPASADSVARKLNLSSTGTVCDTV